MRQFKKGKTKAQTVTCLAEKQTKKKCKIKLYSLGFLSSLNSKLFSV